MALADLALEVRAMPDRRTPEIESPSANRMQGAAGIPHQLDDPTTAPSDPNRERQDRNVEEPGDTDSADIVGRTGEQMPQQSHDGLESEKRESPTRPTDDNV